MRAIIVNAALPPKSVLQEGQGCPGCEVELEIEMFMIAPRALERTE
jgi:hypothetical protein